MIDKDKTYTTRDGREVRIYSVDGGEDMPVHGAILTKWGWKVSSWTPDGFWAVDVTGGCDLIEVKPRIKREVWVNVYPEESGWNDQAHNSRASADHCACDARIACVHLTIDCEEGEGLT